MIMKSKIIDLKFEKASIAADIELIQCLLCNIRVKTKMHGKFSAYFFLLACGLDMKFFRYT